MRLPNGSGTDHATLALLELVAVPVAVLATVLTLVLADVGFAAFRTAVTAAGGGDAVAELGTAVLAFGTLLVLVVGAGSLVAGYRRYVDDRFDVVSPLPLLLVPAVGIVCPIGYAVWDTGALRLSSPLFLLVAVAAHAFAYRTIALVSLREDRGRTSLVVGSLTGLPAVVALVALANATLGPDRPIGRTLETVVAGPESQIVRTAVIAVPLLVTALYGVEALLGTQSRWERPNWSLPRPRLSRLAHRLRNRTESSGRRPAGAASGRASSESGRSSRGTARQTPRNPSNAVVPSSPGSGATRRSRSSDDRDGDAGASADDSTAASSATDDRSADDSDATARDDGSPSEGNDDAAGTAGAAETAGAVADSSTDDTGTGSDTQIFTADFDQYGADETPVDRCPDCEKEIPSDGVYNFCPFCGGEL
ncbi:zinc ribbon domain-containing protein [Natrinema marinum]|uniref:zinc ribbon domain-containing protein n=1 Tax=Natrinema marinum TaxID=2961598 RepID=UPI0020C912EB|nr:zinc ribbon domain-containing protein [Natrinema marinum]